MDKAFEKALRRAVHIKRMMLLRDDVSKKGRKKILKEIEELEKLSTE